MTQKKDDTPTVCTPTGYSGHALSHQGFSLTCDIKKLSSTTSTVENPIYVSRENLAALKEFYPLHYLVGVECLRTGRWILEVEPVGWVLEVEPATNTSTRGLP